MANPKCPECGAPLERVRYGGGYLNEDQFNSIRAGDWFCGNVEITHSPQRLRGRDQHLAYWWNRELTPMATPQEPPAADDVGAIIARIRELGKSDRLRGELWSLSRHILGQGQSQQQDYDGGKYKGYEEFSARMDAAARERADEALALFAEYRTLAVQLAAHVEALQAEKERLRADTDDFDDAERWRKFADGADRETTSNGDNAFVRYVGEWVVAEAHHDPEDGDYLTPRTPYEWIDATPSTSEGRADGE